MPIYEYHCSACGKDFEVSQRMSDAPLTACSCGSEGTVERLIGNGAGVIFKGSGFYQTDYKNSGSSSAPSSTKTESKPAEAASSGGHSCGSGCGCAG